MVSEGRIANQSPACVGVLILVVMEDGLRDFKQLAATAYEHVLILVVMEDGLRGC